MTRVTLNQCMRQSCWRRRTSWPDWRSVRSSRASTPLQTASSAGREGLPEGEQLRLAMHDGLLLLLYRTMLRFRCSPFPQLPAQKCTCPRIGHIISNLTMLSLYYNRYGLDICQVHPCRVFFLLHNWRFPIEWRGGERVNESATSRLVEKLKRTDAGVTLQFIRDVD